MKLYILRHGLAGDSGSARYPDDSQRPLTAEGKDEMRQIAKAIKKLNLSFDLILSSPYKRARQTAEIVAEGLGLSKKLEFSETLTPNGDMPKLIESLNRRKAAQDSVVLVGHEPYLSGLISLLVSGERGFSVALKKGGLTSLKIESLKAGRCGELKWLLTPKQMLAICG